MARSNDSTTVLWRLALHTCETVMFRVVPKLLHSNMHSCEKVLQLNYKVL